MSLPSFMIAPTGARRTKADHPALPMTINEIVSETSACVQAGANGLHLHVRDTQGVHSLDAILYREALQALEKACPGLPVQITTEAMGRYTPQDQRDLVWALRPGWVSVSLREMLSQGENKDVKNFYHACADAGITVQHILYSDVDYKMLLDLLGEENFQTLSLLFVLGRYNDNQNSYPSDLEPFLACTHHYGLSPDWAVCAFGPGETDCLQAAHHKGGKIRIGFENSLWHADGTLATSNAERVRTLMALLTPVCAG